MDPLPGAVGLPAAEVVEGGTVGHQVVGQGPPGAALAGLVEEGVKHLAAAVLGRPAPRLGLGDQMNQPLPLGVGENGLHPGIALFHELVPGLQSLFAGHHRRKYDPAGLSPFLFCDRLDLGLLFFSEVQVCRQVLHLHAEVLSRCF